ncbi:GTP-binding protein [Pseudonocardia kujensis]|uniref:ribosome hibernation factor-recruiting GTPase MRF n=1 Tax=Pseudonocardia kujensis TaxID=1128675 RepID=UPI001E4B7E3E|nr:GTP-binding protein [Pseudonocardia kujensis]MCE0762592.1 GTP-binding protein [Pseudonocardia kujensis]
MPDTELLVVTGLCAEGVERVLARLRTADPDVVVVHHDLRDIARGRLRRRIRDRGSDTWTERELTHGCVSCTLREDLLPMLRRLAGRVRRVVLHLDPALEPEQVCWALAHVLVDGIVLTDLVDLRGVVTAVDAASWLDDATGDEPAAERGLADLPDDERTVAQVAVAQAEFADLLVHTGTTSAWEHARVDAVLERLAPTALRSRLAELDDDAVLLRRTHVEARRGRPDDVHGPLLRGAPPLATDCGVRLLVFSARRPFHPDRLHGAIDLLLDGVVRTRGRIWLATRPDDVLWLESAGGGLRIGQAGEWLAGQDPAAWDEVSDERRALAALGWHPRFGDRAQDVVVLAHALDAGGLDAVEAGLRSALLTDAELAAGEETWPTLTDPFGFWHTDPCGQPEPAGHEPAGREAERSRGEEC